MTRVSSSIGMLMMVLSLSLMAASSLAQEQYQYQELEHESPIVAKESMAVDANQRLPSGIVDLLRSTPIMLAGAVSDSDSADASTTHPDTLALGNTVRITNSKIIMASSDNTDKVARIVRMINKNARGGDRKKDDAALKKAIFRVLGVSRDDHVVALLIDAAMQCRDDQDMLLKCTKALVAAAEVNGETEPNTKTVYVDSADRDMVTKTAVMKKQEDEAFVAGRTVVVRPPVVAKRTVVAGGGRPFG